MMSYPPHIRRRPKSAFANQVLGVRVRQAEQEIVVIPLKLTEPRLKLMKAIDEGHVKAGQGSHVGEWRWAGTTVTERTNQLIRAGWAVGGKTVELTDAGKAAMEGAQ